jgi:hypothetical protein
MSDSLYPTELVLSEDGSFVYERSLKDMTPLEKRVTDYFVKSKKKIYFFGMANQYYDYCRMLDVRCSLHHLKDMPKLKGLAGITCIPVMYQDLDPDVIVQAAMHEVSVLTEDGLEVPRPLSPRQYHDAVEERDHYCTDRSLFLYAQIEALPENIDVSAVELYPNQEAYFILKYNKRGLLLPNLSDRNIEVALSWLAGRNVKLPTEVEPSIEMAPITPYVDMIAPITDQEDIKPREAFFIQNRDCCMQVVVNGQVVQTMEVDGAYNNYIRYWARAVAPVIFVKRQNVKVRYCFDQRHPGLPSVRCTNERIFNDVICCLAQTLCADLQDKMIWWIKCALEYGAYSSFSDNPPTSTRMGVEVYTTQFLLGDPVRFVSHSRICTYSSEYQNYIGFLSHGPYGFQVNLGRLVNQNLIIVLPKTSKEVRIRITVEIPGANYTHDITLYHVGITPVDFHHAHRAALAPFAELYNFYEIDSPSFLVDTQTWHYVPLYWINVTLEGKWYGSRPLIRGDIDQAARCYDIKYSNESDIARVDKGRITIAHYPEETRLHIINSKIIF